MRGVIKYISSAFFISLFLITPIGEDERDNSQPSIVIELKNPYTKEEYKIKKEEQKEIKKYCKEKNLDLVTKDEATNSFKRKNAEIMAPLFQKPPEELEAAKNKIQEELLSIPEIARWATFELYVTDSNTVDSSQLLVYSFPYKKTGNVNFKKTIVHPHGSLSMDCIKALIDTCIVNGYFK